MLSQTEDNSRPSWGRHIDWPLRQEGSQPEGSDDRDVECHYNQAERGGWRDAVTPGMAARVSALAGIGDGYPWAVALSWRLSLEPECSMWNVGGATSSWVLYCAGLERRSRL
jgi:hypothetical protein